MKKQIFKYPIASKEIIPIIITMPEGAQILTCQTQREIPCIWALVDPTAPKETRHFDIFGTGHDIEDNKDFERKYIDTFQVQGGSFVYHLFERLYN